MTRAEIDKVIKRRRFYIVVQYGTHRTDVEVIEEDYRKWIDNLATEFEVFSYRGRIPRRDGWIEEETCWRIENYWGDIETIAYERRPYKNEEND